MTVINKANKENHVKFISYTGKYPNLCTGDLILEVDGKRYTFGLILNRENILPTFWDSGGSCGFSKDYSESYVYPGKWIINADELPQELQKYADEIDELFNENVPYGCCGGCL